MKHLSLHRYNIPFTGMVLLDRPLLSAHAAYVNTAISRSFFSRMVSAHCSSMSHNGIASILLILVLANHSANDHLSCRLEKNIHPIISIIFTVV
jgi:hypothetical protein